MFNKQDLKGPLGAPEPKTNPPGFQHETLLQIIIPLRLNKKKTGVEHFQLGYVLT